MRKRPNADHDIVGGLLARLPAAQVLHSLKAPRSKSGVDHLVVGPCGIFAIDVLQRTGAIKARKDSLWLGATDLRDECVAAQKKAGEVGRYMQHSITPVLCFTDAKLPAPVIHLRHVVVCTPGILQQYINGGPRCLDARAVQFFADRASPLAQRAAGEVSTPATVQRQPRPHTRQPRSSSAPAPAGRTGFFGRRILATAAGTMLCIVGASAVPVLAHLTDPQVDQFVHAIGSSKPNTVVLAGSNEPVVPALGPTEVSKAEATLPTSLAGESASGSEMLPKLDFTCPQQGAGWTASAVQTGVEADPVGYHLWYQTSPGLWEYWGHFKSAIQSPAGLPGLQPGEALDVRMDRSLHPNAEGAPTMLTFTAPDATC